MALPNVTFHARTPCRPATLVKVLPTSGLTCSIISPYDPLLVAIIKALPQKARRFDKKAKVWRVSVVAIDKLIDVLLVNNFAVVDERGKAGAA